MHAQHGREEGNENKQSLLRKPAVSFNLGQLVSDTKKRRKKKKSSMEKKTNNKQQKTQPEHFHGRCQPQA